jgi:DNA-binding transcriptional LysR family regulator
VRRLSRMPCGQPDASAVRRWPCNSVALELDDRLVDLVGGGLDVAIRIGAPADSSAIMRKLAENRRILVAAPAYLNRAGRSATPDEAVSRAFLRAMAQPLSPGAFVGRMQPPPTLQRPHDCASMTAMSSTTGRWPALASC